MNIQDLRDLTQGISKVVTEATADPGVRAAMTSFLMSKCLGEAVMSVDVRNELIKYGKKNASKPALPKTPQVRSVPSPNPGHKAPQPEPPKR